MSGTRSQKAFAVHEDGSTKVYERAVPKPGPDEILVKIKAAALNPIDWILALKISLGFPVSYPLVLGSDAAGVVDQVGDNVKDYQAGDRVIYNGYFVGDAADKGTFQEYSIVSSNAVAKIPHTLSFEDAATIPLTLSTAAVGLYQKQEGNLGAGLVAPWDKGGVNKYAGKPIVIFGGASSNGLFAIQLAKISGFSPIIATASENNFAQIKSVGATHPLSRSLSPAELSASITKIVNGIPIEVVYDAISIPDTQQLGWDILAKGGSLVIVLGDQINKGSEAEAKEKHVANVAANVNLPQNIEFGLKLYGSISGWLESGAIQPNQVEVLPGGLQGIPDGLERLKNKGVSGVKLVIRPEETA